MQKITYKPTFLMKLRKRMRELSQKDDMEFFWWYIYSIFCICQNSFFCTFSQFFLVGFFLTLSDPFAQILLLTEILLSISFVRSFFH